MNGLNYLIELDRKKAASMPQAVPTSTFATRALHLGQLAALCNCPETSLSRLLNKHGILADIQVGSRVAFSIGRANEINAWLRAATYSRTALNVIDSYEFNPLGTGSPLSANKQAPLLECAAKFEAAAAARLAKLIKFQNPTPTN